MGPELFWLFPCLDYDDTVSWIQKVYSISQYFLNKSNEKNPNWKIF